MLSESKLQILAILNPELGSSDGWLSVQWCSDKELDLLAQLKDSPDSLRSDFEIGDIIEPTVFQADDNMLHTFLVAPAKK